MHQVKRNLHREKPETDLTAISGSSLLHLVRSQFIWFHSDAFRFHLSRLRIESSEIHMSQTTPIWINQIQPRPEPSHPEIIQVNQSHPGFIWVKLSSFESTLFIKVIQELVDSVESKMNLGWIYSPKPTSNYLYHHLHYIQITSYSFRIYLRVILSSSDSSHLCECVCFEDRSQRKWSSFLRTSSRFVSFDTPSTQSRHHQPARRDLVGATLTGCQWCDSAPANAQITPKNSIITEARKRLRKT